MKDLNMFINETENSNDILNKIGNLLKFGFEKIVKNQEKIIELLENKNK